MPGKGREVPTCDEMISVGVVQSKSERDPYTAVDCRFKAINRLDVWDFDRKSFFSLGMGPHEGGGITPGAVLIYLAASGGRALRTTTPASRRG